VTTYVYDPVSNLIRIDFPNGTVETRQYDLLDRLTSLTHTGTTGIIASYKYTLDPVGNRIAVEENDGRKVNYTYDPLYRLTQEAISDPQSGNRTITYTYDAVSNRLTRNDSVEGVTTYTYDANDRLLTETLNGSNIQYTYDNNGNLITRVKNPNDQIAYTWDDEGRLIAVEITNNQGTRRIEYRYDADGIRVATIADGQETRFLVDREDTFAQVLEEYTPDGTTKVAYVRGLDLIS
jgi:YD repeat-containing protein